MTSQNLRKNSNFWNPACLLFNGELPESTAIEHFNKKVLSHGALPSSVNHVIDSFSDSTHPMGV